MGAPSEHGAHGAHGGMNLPLELAPLETAAQMQAVARLYGEPMLQLPADLYIPPDALEIILDAFEGPLDLLLYLIRKSNLDILDIPMAPLTAQYLVYVEAMRSHNLELAADYLLMAAMLLEIKSRMLLPRPSGDEEDEDDPRAELIRRLQEYEQIKGAAQSLDELPRLEREIHLARAERPEPVRRYADPEVDLKEVLLALASVLRRAEMFQRHQVQLERLSVRERMSDVLDRVNQSGEFLSFPALFDVREGRMGVVVTFLALLELMREGLLELVQNAAFAPIYVRAAGE